MNALPAESVRLFDLARAAAGQDARALYDWFLPLLRLDTVPKFVQLIKLVQAEVGRGNASASAAASRSTGPSTTMRSRSFASGWRSARA